jgi:hypothetical protein
MLNRPISQIGGNFANESELSDSHQSNDTIVSLLTGERYAVSTVSGGVALASGNYAHIIGGSEFTPLSIATTLQVGGKYLSTATASHTVPIGLSIGDEIQITWKDGTTMTLTSASNISVTSSVKTTDTTWVFTNFISILTLVWGGTEWGIK